MIYGIDPEVLLECIAFGCAALIAMYAVALYLGPVLQSMSERVLQQHEQDEKLVRSMRNKLDSCAKEIAGAKVDYAQWSAEYSNFDTVRQEILEKLLVLPENKLDHRAIQYASVLTLLQGAINENTSPPLQKDLDEIDGCL